MCMLFLYVNDNASENEYRIILASNRDEVWDRPTKPLGFWDDNPQCISGRDLEVGTKGGTWLGMSKQGRIGVLVNIKGNPEAKKTRGNLVNEFLTSGLTGQQYISNEVEPRKDDYNGFQLTVVDLSASHCDVNYFNNKCSDVTTVLENGICVIGNATSTRCPWQKCIYGKKKFESIVKNYHSKERKDDLTNALLDLQKDSTQFPDDPQIAKQSEFDSTKAYRDGLSSPFVWLPSDRYGTRTHSIILIDGSGHCDFSERTMVTPVDPANVQWEFNSYQFDVVAN